MVFQNNLLAGASGATGAQAAFDPTLIGNSVWLDGSADDLDRSTTSHSSTEMVMACWFQLTTTSTGNIGLMGLGTGTSGSTNAGLWLSANKMYIYNVGQGAQAAQLFRDIGWYHILGSWKLDESGSNKGKLYINGAEVTNWSDDRRSSFGTAFGSTATQSVGSIFTNTFLNGYIAQPVMLDGQSIQGGDVAITDFVDTFTFGTNGSQVIPKKNSDIAALATTAGGNSFCLDFADSSGTDAANLGNDIANNNDLTPNSMSSDNQSGNTPSNSYPIWNPLEPTNSTLSFSEGNLRATGSGGSDGGAIGTIPLPTSGTSEFQIKANNGDGRVGIIALDGAVGVDEPSNNCAGGVGVNFNAAYHYSENGQVRRVLSSGNTNVSGFDSWSTNDVITVRYNADANELNFLRNNSAVGSTISTEAGLVYYPVVCRFNNYDITAFFDSSKFPHTIGTGNLEVSSANQTAPDFQGIDYFDVTLYEGNGGGQRVGDFVPFTDAYTVNKSAIFENADKRYLSFTPSAGGDQKTFTFSTWFKLSNPNIRNCFLSSGTTGGKQAQILHMGDTSEKDINVNMYNGSSFLLNLNTDRAFLDTSQWYHLVVAIDTRSAVASANKVKIYINGVQQSTNGTQLSTDDYDSHFNANVEHNIGRQTNNAVGEPSWYLAETVMVEGSQLDPTSFGQVDTSTNRWIPKDVSGLTFGDEGWYLEYDGTGFGSGGSGETPANGAGKDSSGNTNHWEEENDSGSDWATTDQSNDTPSNNHAVLDGQDTIGSATPTLSQGNLTYTGADNGGRYVSGFPLTSGKWYWELECTTIGAFYPGFFTPAGISFSSSNPWLGNSGSFNISPGPSGGHWLGANGDGTTILYGPETLNTGGPGRFIQDGDRMFFAFDADNKFAYIGEVGSGGSGSTLTYYGLNGAVTGDPTSGAAGTGAAPFGLNTIGEDTFYFGAVSGGSSSSINFLFDSTKWNGTPPTGYKALTQDNLDDTASKITAWAWIKNRDASSDHMLIDRVRGVGKDIHSNSDAVEATNSNTVQRFLQRGVQIGNDSTVNTVNNSFVLWQWLVGDSATTGTVFSADNPPSIASTVVAADADHFSIGTYTGDGGTSATIKHGLTAAPEMIWVKNRSVADEWIVGTEYNSYSSPWNYYAHLTTTGTFAANSNAWNNTAPTSSVFTVGTSDRVNASSENYVFYCFRSVPGVCKVGQYAVNNTGDNGPYVPLGFKPRWIMFKSATSVVSQWTIYDSVREPFNVGDHIFSYVNLNSADQAFAANDIDILSDGFKIRSDANNEPNNGSGVYSYLAMADIGGNGTLPPIYGR